MINFTTSFTTMDELEQLLRESSVKDSTKMLIQFFCADVDITTIKQIQLFFKNRYPNSTFIGTTTDGAIEGSKVYGDTKSVVTFTLFEDTELKSALLKNDDWNNDSFSIGIAIAKRLCSDETKVLISFADGIHTNGEEYVNGISSVDSKLIISGGLAADNGNLVKTYIFDKDEITSDGAIGVSLNNKNLRVTTNYTFDWMPIGKKMCVTKAIKNRVYEIEGIPAVDIYAKYLGKELASKLPQMGIEFPLVFEKDDVLIGRVVLFKHDDGSLTFAGNIQEGTKVRFGIGNIEKILANSDFHTRTILEKLNYQAQAVFVYSCMARRRFMHKHIEDELEALTDLGNVSGFFTYGEFFHSQDNNQLLNETMTILILSEGNEPLDSTLKSRMKIKRDFVVSSEHVIAHLANTVSNELAELNENLKDKVKESAEYICKRAYLNKLTGLPNRLSLIEKLKQSVDKTLFLINIDDFTVINDFYGHKIGDKVIIKLASVIKDLVKNENAQIFKLPSDEFAIIMDIEYSQQIIENRIKKFIFEIEKEIFLFNKHSLHITVTMSASYINKSGSGLVNANMSLKLAKKAGRDFLIFNRDLKLAKQYSDNIKIINIIKIAIGLDGIIPYFQPIFDAKTGKVEKYESLVRLRQENGEILSPFHFLEISKKIKLYPQITKIMVEKSFSYFAKNGLNFSINLAFSDILNENTKEFIFRKIVEYDIAKQLTIEILETQEIDEEKSIYKFIDSVYSHGAKIAIDDFGSGFANFKHMTGMRSDYMKIDGSLIRDIDTDEDTRLVVETIIIFAKKLKKKTIAEFVHSKNIYNIVRELDIDFIQGYYLGEPSESLLKTDMENW